MGANSLSNKLLICLFIMSSAVLGQGRAVWGEVPKEQLEMKTYPADTNANAVILSDYGETTLNNDADLEFFTHERIKILNTNGFEEGTIEVTLYTADRSNQIKNIEGVTYFLDANGVMQKKELNSDDIITETVTENTTKYKFTLPALTPGCVIEYRYKIVSQSLWSIRNWSFQGSEPVMWSEYKVIMPVNIVYTAIRKGYEPYEIVSPGLENVVFSGEAASLLGNRVVSCNIYHWAVKNAPAVRDEPYMTTKKDYLNMVDLQLSSYAFEHASKKVLYNWETVADELRKSTSFYKLLKPNDEVAELVKEVTKGAETGIDSIKAIHNWVTSKMVFDGTRRFESNFNDVEEILKAKKGCSADINLFMLSMLRSAGFTCYPVVISTRSNGKIQDLYPILRQFNSVVTQVRFNGEMIYLDATSSENPYNLLPTGIIGVKGFVVTDTGEEWVAIPVTKKSTVKSLAEVEITEDGLLNGNLQEVFIDYAAINVRSEFKEKKDEEVLKDAINGEGSEFTYDSIMVFGKDTVSSMLTIKARISSSGMVQSAGDMMYIPTSIAHKIDKSPFKSEIRNFPIDFGYLRSRTVEHYIVIPDGYEVKEKPVNTSSYTEDTGLLYTRKITVDGRRIKIEKKFEVKATELKPNIYESVKNFYSRVIKAEAEVIVLAKKKETMPAPAAPAPPSVPEKKESVPEKSTQTKKAKK